MDFVNICSRVIEKGPNKGRTELHPDFRVGRSTDLMIRGRTFYAVWDEKAGLWSTDEYDVRRLVDEALYEESDRYVAEGKDAPIVRNLSSFGTGGWSQFRKFIQNISDNSKDLDGTLTFADTEVKKSDHASKRLPYSLEPGKYDAWDEMVGTLYNVEERAKLEWAIGAVVSGDARRIQKFLVLYGPAGTGKSTMLNILQMLFAGYVATFDAKALGSSNAAFATEVFKNNPLVAIQHDGDLSKIEDNTKLNSIISHEDMLINEKYKAGYTSAVNAFLFMGTNQPVKISDAKSGIIRRLIDVHPTGVKLPAGQYHTLMSQIEFELGAIAYHCLQVYREMGKNYYNGYRPLEMMLQTDVFFNFIEANFDIFDSQDSTTLKQAYALYKEFCADTGIDRVLPQYKVREELRNYFEEFHDRAEVDGAMLRSVYTGFTANKFKQPAKDDQAYSLVLEESESLLDDILGDMPAQYANDVGTPNKAWRTVKTKLIDVDTSQLHYVKVPENHIVIDFDLKGEDGGKDLERNLRAASEWPATYGELSQGGAGVHLHYIWTGSVPASELRLGYSEGIEVKRYAGDASLRRRLSRCNAVPIAELKSGLPLKEKSVLSDKTIQSEKGLRALIARNLKKEIQPGTKPSIDFIHHILEEAYASGMTYDVTDLRGRLIVFANNSSNQSLACLKIVMSMKFKSENSAVDQPDFDPKEPQRAPDKAAPRDDRLVFWDVEVYPNLFVICWKFAGSDSPMVKMINPSAQQVEELFSLKLVGFNNRKYDNHILYGAYLGYDNARLYELSQKIIDNDRSAMFGEAYGISYTDIYDFTSLKQSLKRYQIQLGLHHMEMNIPWDRPVPKELVDKVVEYCSNDVETTEAVFESRRQDFVARQILADLSGLSVNEPTQKHTAKIIFGDDRTPQNEFIYTNLAEEFDGYVFELGKSSYKGEDPSEGGYVYAEPGVYDRVGVLDIASMHPTSLIELEYFGKRFTPRFKELLDARLAIKRRDYDTARSMLDGKLAAHLGNVADADALAYALKIVINIVYGLTAARFPNVFRDNRNVDNIVAKRGALFMIDLKLACEEQGWPVVHIKTDSIKLADITEEKVKFVQDFGANYGYTFEHEATYDKFALVNDAVYIARRGTHWDATGAQFQHPYVYKKLFSGEPITFDDMCETKQVTQGAMYLDFEHDRPMFMVDDNLVFVGRTGRFTPVREGFGGAQLWRVKEGKNFAVSGTKGYLWVESDQAKELGPDAVNTDYFEELCSQAVKAIEKYGSFDEFVSN